MKFLSIIKKCGQAGLLFFIVCVVQAAPIAEKDSGLQNIQQEAFAALVDEEAITLDDVVLLPQWQVEQPQNNSGESKEQQNPPGTQLDKAETTLVDKNSEYEQFSEEDAFFKSSGYEIKSGGWSNKNTLQHEVHFNNIDTSPRVFKQNDIIRNSQQLKMLAHNVFGEETLEDVLMAQQEVKMLVDQADAWIKEVLFDDSNWRLEDSIYGSAAILFINDSSLIRFLKKLDGNSDDINQIRKQLEQQDKPQKDLTLETDSIMAQGYFSIMEFLKNYASTLMYLVLAIVILVEIYNLISKALKPKEKQKSRRGSRRRSRPTDKKERSSAIPVSVYGRVESNSVANSGVATRGEKPRHSSKSHKNRRRRVKRSWVRKVLDETFSDSKKNH